MAIEFTVSGRQGKDNALLVKVSTGQKTWRLLFDCGEGVLKPFSQGEIQQIDSIFFSHFHMDHVAGFDSFFRCNYARPTKPVRIFGPEQTCRIIQNRLRGFIWNLIHKGTPGEFIVTEIHKTMLRTEKFYTREHFNKVHSEPDKPFQSVCFDNEDIEVRVCQGEHKTVSLAYAVSEKPKQNIATQKLKEMSLVPGVWCQDLKNTELPDDLTLKLQEKEYKLGDLRAQVLETIPGKKISYLTDMKFTDESRGELLSLVKDSNWLIAECAYKKDEAALAKKYCHLTTEQIAKFALEAGVENLILFHVSDRYSFREHRELLEEVREIFPNAEFPEHWH